jgi:hypothetical protein
MISDLAMKHRFLNAMDTGLRRAVLSQIISENTLDIILTIAEKNDAVNHTIGIYRHPGSKQIASNTIAQAKPKQESVPTQTSNFGHAQNAQHHNNPH